VWAATNKQPPADSRRTLDWAIELGWKRAWLSIRDSNLCTIPSNRVQFIVPQIIETRKVTHTDRAALGVTVASVDATMAERDHFPVDHGALIVTVAPNGPAAQASLQPGDVIVQVDGKAVTDVPSLGDALVNKNPGETVSVQGYRDSQHLTLNVKLGELSAG
jgi:S1-C subfamily serine protease